MTGQGATGSRADPASETGRNTAKYRDLPLRIASGLVMMGVAIGTTLIGGAVFNLFWLAAGLAVFWEWQRLIGGRGHYRRFAVGAVALAATAPLAGTGRAGLALLVLLAGAGVLAALAESRHRGMTALGLAYAGALVFSVCLLRHSSLDGLRIILWLFAVVWGTDVMAYVGGRSIGGPKLAPRLSPSKTWSGFGVGICSGSLFGLAIAPLPGCSLCYLACGLLVGAIAQGGDLFESALKRRFGVKDAGRLIPGHGGVMDRLDGFIAAAVFAAGMGLWRFGADAAGAGLLTW